MVAHEQTHLKLGNNFQLFQSSLHYLIQLFLDFTALAVDILQFSLGNCHQRTQILLLFVQSRVDFVQDFSRLVVLLSHSD